MTSVFIRTLLITALLCCHTVFCQSQVDEKQNIAHLIRIWGLIKYQHPQASKGAFDINAEFLSEWEKITGQKKSDEINLEFSRWISHLDGDNSRYRTGKIQNKNIKQFTDFSWIQNSGFSSELISALEKLHDNSHIGTHYASQMALSSHLDFTKDKPIIGFNPDITAHRMLFLAAFWNLCNYWNVNTSITDKKWDAVLLESIPDFLNSGRENFEFAKEKLFAQLNDSHADYPASYSMNKIFTHFPPFAGRIVNDSLVVTMLRNPDRAHKNGIGLGDVIFSADDNTFKDYFSAKFRDRISTSNPNHLKNITQKFFALASSEDSIKVGVLKKDGSKSERYLKLYPLSENPSKPEWLYVPKAEKHYFIKDDIGYINLAKMDKSELKAAFESFEHSKGIILDLRNYPKLTYELAHYLYPEKKVFVKLQTAIAPGYAEYDSQSSLRLVSNPFSAGKNNKNHYKGKVVLLVDRSTGSQAEFIGMLIQQSPNCITLGEQTFGAVMNRQTISLMDGTTVDYTFAGSFYPDDTPVQRNGLKIDTQLEESARNFDPEYYLKQAVKVVEAP